MESSDSKPGVDLGQKEREFMRLKDGNDPYMEQVQGLYAKEHRSKVVRFKVFTAWKRARTSLEMKMKEVLESEVQEELATWKSVLRTREIQEEDLEAKLRMALEVAEDQAQRSAEWQDMCRAVISESKWESRAMAEELVAQNREQKMRTREIQEQDLEVQLKTALELSEDLEVQLWTREIQEEHLEVQLRTAQEKLMVYDNLGYVSADDDADVSAY